MMNSQFNKSKTSGKPKTVRFRVATSYIDEARSSVRATANRDILAQIDAVEKSSKNTQRANKIASIRSNTLTRSKPIPKNTEPEVFIFPNVDIDIPVYKPPTAWADAVRQTKLQRSPIPEQKIAYKDTIPSPSSLFEEGSYLLAEQFDIDDLEEERLRRAVVREYEAVYEDLLTCGLCSGKNDRIWYVPAGHSGYHRPLLGVYPQNVPIRV